MSETAKTTIALPPSTVPTSSPLELPPRLFVPLPYELAADPLDAGAKVTRGQRLAITGAGHAHVPLSPAAGTIIGTKEVQLLDGRTATAIEIEVDPSDEDTPAPNAPTEVPADLHKLIDRLRHAGVCASRHTSPDLMSQLHEATTRKIDLLICSLLDVDGGSSLHGKIIRESGPLVIAGVRALSNALGSPKTLIAADPSLATRASVHVRKANAGAKIKIQGLENDYPQSDPSLLLFTLTGERLRPGNLPSSAGVILLDGVAAAAIGRCLERGESMLTVPIEIRDSTRARSHVAVAAVGTPLRFVLESLGLRGSYTLRAGAALRDVRVCPDAIVSGSGEISIDAGAASTLINPDPCIRCGWCVENCPVSINPAALLEAAQDNDSEMAEAYGLPACIECGICSYVCPSRLPLLPSIRDLRKKFGPAGIDPSPWECK